MRSIFFSLFKEYREAFLMVDKTDTGFIPKSELGRCVRTLGLNPRETELKNVQGAVDAEGEFTANQSNL